MNIVFFGTPYYVIPILEKLHKAFKAKNTDSPIVAVVTQMPKLAGRKKYLQHSAVDKWAYNKKVPIYFRAQDIINKKIKADIGVLASYGEIISKGVIDHFPNKILNIHPSLLPKFRGASPVQSTIVSGETQTGGTIIRLDEELDHGPVVGQFKEEVLNDDTTQTLRDRLFERSADVLTTLIPAYINGKIKPQPQDHEKATFTHQIKKQDAYIDPKRLQKALDGKSSANDWNVPFIDNFTSHYSPATIHRFIRAMLPWPVAWTHINLEHTTKDIQHSGKRILLEQATRDKEPSGKRLKILKCHLETKDENTNPSSRISPVTYLILDEVQLEGKTPVTWQQFTQGYPHVHFS